MGARFADATSGRKRMYKLTADREAGAKIIALACSEPPPERSRRTLNLLAGKVVKLDILDSISDHGTGDLLKNSIKPWIHKQWYTPVQVFGPRSVPRRLIFSIDDFSGPRWLCPVYEAPVFSPMFFSRKPQQHQTCLRQRVTFL